MVANDGRKLTVVVGAPRHGKSTWTAALVKASPDPNALIYLEEVDIENSAWQDFPLVSIWQYRGGKCKISAAEIGYDEFLALVNKYFRNGIVVVDEGGLHEDGKLSDGMLRLCASRGKTFVNVFVLYHGLYYVPLKQFTYINNIILFHTSDNFAHASRRIPRMAEMMAAKEQITKEVMAGKKYYCRYIKLS